MGAVRVASVAVVCLLGAGCGSRTGLLVPGVQDEPGGTETEAGAIEADDCADAGPTPIIVVTQQQVLYAFDPPTARFNRIGDLLCPNTFNQSPFSMAVARNGFAYVVYSPDGTLFRVSTANASCTPTPFTAGQKGFSTLFGMGFSANAPAPGETLYVTGYDRPMLASIDTNTWALRVIGSAPIRMELTGTRAGDLFGFLTSSTSPTDTEIAHIDKTTGRLTPVWPLPFPFGMGWAFAAWGGVFYTFTGTSNATTEVHRFDPQTQDVTVVAAINDLVVGAGVSTCAPGQ
jgi:hypothetical protein